jgi:hypothetical protein
MDLVRAERLDDVTLPRESQPLSSHRHIFPATDGTPLQLTCNDGEPEPYTPEMGALNKAKLAAKRAAIKGLPTSTRDLSLVRVGTAASRPGHLSRTRGLETHDEGAGDGK